MKKIFCFLLLAACFLKPSAQVCWGVTADVIAPQPQSGPYNYFGVKVSLNEAYGQNVVVQGYIYDEGNYNTNNPFSLTILTGYLTEETALNFYQTCPACTAEVTITSVNPCPSDPPPYDYVGIYHNSGIGDCINSQSPFDCITSYFQNLFPNLFSQQTISDIMTAAQYAASNDSTNYVPQFLSTNGQSYSSQLISMIDATEESSELEGLITDISSLESEISGSNLSNNEKQILLYAASIARNSLSFWIQHVDTSEASSLAILYLNNSENTLVDNNILYAKENSQRFAKEMNLGYPNLTIAENNTTYKKSWFRQLLHVVVGDVVGGLVGAGMASLLGSNPILTFAGAFFGGMSGSLKAADDEGWLD